MCTPKVLMSILRSTLYLLEYTHKSEYSGLTRVLLKPSVLCTYSSTNPQYSTHAWCSHSGRIISVLKQSYLKPNQNKSCHCNRQTPQIAH